MLFLFLAAEGGDCVHEVANVYSSFIECNPMWAAVSRMIDGVEEVPGSVSYQHIAEALQLSIVPTTW